MTLKVGMVMFVKRDHANLEDAVTDLAELAHHPNEFDKVSPPVSRKPYS